MSCIREYIIVTLVCQEFLFFNCSLLEVSHHSCNLSVSSRVWYRVGAWLSDWRIAWINWRLSGLHRVNAHQEGSTHHWGSRGRGSGNWAPECWGRSGKQVAFFLGARCSRVLSRGWMDPVSVCWPRRHRLKSRVARAQSQGEPAQPHLPDMDGHRWMGSW